VNFYDAYVKYQGDLADWNMKYAPKPVYAPSNNIMAPPVTALPAGAATPLQPG
jgi:hypothetical protein